MNWFGFSMALVAVSLLAPASRADEGKNGYEPAVRCEKNALRYYTETEQPKNTSNNSVFYESFIESHFNAGANRCFALISAMAHKYHDNTAVWSDTLIDMDSNTAFGSLKKTVDLRSNTVDAFQCSINGEQCSSKSEFKERAKAYMEN